jgi:ligand-binding sensor domain-containing protein
MNLRALLLFVVFWSGTQLTRADSQSYLVKHYSNQDYHAGNQNWSVVAEPDGFVYFGNNDGLLIFDGNRWTTLRIPGQTIVRSVYVAADKRIYTGSYEEFGYWEKDQNHEYRYHSLKPTITDAAFHNSEVWKIVQLGRKIYFQSFSSLFVYDGKHVKPIAIPGTVIFLLKASNRLFVQSVNGNFYEILNDALVDIDANKVLAGTEVKTILPYPGNAFLVGTTSDGLFFFDGKTISPWKSEANDSLKRYQINNGLIIGDHLIIGTIVNGLFVLDIHGNILHHLDNGNALQNNTVLSLGEGPDGSLWVGLDKGIDNISFNNILDLYQEKGEQLGAVYTAALFKGTLYIGTNRGIFTYDSQGENGSFRFSGFLENSQGQVWQLKVIDGTLFCGHTSGTYILEGRTLRMVSKASGGYSIQKAEKEGNPFLIQSSYSPLTIYRSDGKNLVYKMQVKGYQEPSRFLEVDHLGNIWIGHVVKGLYKLRLSDNLDSVTSQIRFGKKDGFPSDFNIGVFRIGNRVVFTTGSMLYTWDDLKNKMIPYSELNQQLEGFEAATRITQIGNDRYWFIKKNDVAIFEIKDSQVRLLFHLFLPLYSVRMVDRYENIVQLDRDRSLICLDNGFAVFNTKTLSEEIPDRSRLLFREVFSSNQEGSKRRIAINGAIPAISHAWNNLAFSFTCINTRYLNKLFQYRLAGLETNWSDWTEKADVEYKRLPRGEYTFMVRTLNDKGQLIGPISLVFEVRPAWFAGPFAYFLYILVALGILFSSRYLIRRRVMRHHEQLRREDEAKVLLEKERAGQEIVKLHNEKLQAEIYNLPTPPWRSARRMNF